MAKKIWYSTPLKYYWEEVYGTQKKFTPEFSDIDIFNILRQNLISRPYRAGETREYRDLIISGIELWKEDMMGEFLHIFFLEKHLRDFLEETPLSDLDGIREYLYQNGQNKTLEYFITKKQEKCVVYNYGLHIPYEKEGYAFSLTLMEDNSIELYWCQGNKNGRVSDKFYKDLIDRKDKRSRTLSKMYRLAINTITYMNCFPECVTEGVPKNTKDKGKSRSNQNIIFQTSEKVIESEITARSKRPHFRKGFFRVLRSDYFTHKKGQIIYVNETMVRGKAKTVSTSEEIGEFKSGTK